MLIDSVRNAEDNETLVLMECLHWEIVFPSESREYDPNSGQFFCTNPSCWQNVPAVFLKPGTHLGWIVHE